LKSIGQALFALTIADLKEQNLHDENYYKREKEAYSRPTGIVEEITLDNIMAAKDENVRRAMNQDDE
jgi:hypothetical protein